MQIDWLTVGAQIVNFLVLLWLLGRFLYRPILDNMEARERYIASRLGEAEQTQTKAERLLATYRQKLEAIESQRQAILNRTEQEAEKEKLKLLEQAREEVEQKRREWLQALAQEEATILHQLRTLLAKELLELARKALQALADESLERSMVQKFLQQIQSLPDDQKQVLLASEDNLWRITSAFDLDENQRHQIETALKALNPGVEIVFERRDNLFCGLALETDGRIWEWNLAAYLEALENSLKQALPQ